jgi:toxin ParE1/3/4
MKVVLTESALADLDDVAEWIGADDWDRADQFVEILRAKCMTLATHARRYPSVEGARPELRKLSFRDYLIFYQVIGGGVDVVRIVHGARDWAALLGEGG